MRILLLTFYYPPDLSAGAFRAGALVEALGKLGIPNLQIDVVTTQPNRYKTFARGAAALEDADGVTVRRIALPPHKSGMRDQTMAFVQFVRQVLGATKGGRWDIVVATSSRLMTAALGAQVARRAGAPLYLDIRDLFTDTIEDVVDSAALRVGMLPILRTIETRTFRAAAKINIVSQGFAGHMQRVAPDQVCSVFPNGIDPPFLMADYRKPANEGSEVPLILYAGNIGEGQGLEHIVPHGAWALAGQARFRVIGDGGRHRQLAAGLDGPRTTPVELHPPVSRAELIAQYRQADILFLHLNDYRAFDKVLPSKIFEYAATGKPILAGVKGYAREFLKANVVGAEVFNPGDAEQLVQAFARLRAGPDVYDRKDFIARFSRQAIMGELARDVVHTAQTA